MIRSMLAPPMALAAAVAAALGGALAPPSAPRPALPTVEVRDIQLAGIGQNIYNAVTPVVQTVVGDVSYVINFTPVIGRIIAAQVNIDYFQGIQPAVAATVNYAAAVLHNPLNFFPISGAYIQTLVNIGYNLVSAQLRFLGLNELPPRPAAGSAKAPGPRAAAAAAPRARAAASAGRAHPAAARTDRAAARRGADPAN